jgi:hypothetical protein
MAVSLLKPPNGGFRSEAASHGSFGSETPKYNGYIFNGHSPTDAIARSDVTVMCVTAVAVGQSQRLYSGVRMLTGNYLSSL